MLLPPRDHDQWKHHCLTGSLHQLIASVRSARSLSESTQTSRVIQPRPPPAPPRHHPPPRGSSPLAERRPRGIRHFSLPEILTLITKHTHPRAAKSRHHPAHRITRSSGRSSSSSSSNGVAHHDGVPLRRGAGARGGGGAAARLAGGGEGGRRQGRVPARGAPLRRGVRVQGRRRRRGPPRRDVRGRGRRAVGDRCRRRRRQRRVRRVGREARDARGEEEVRADLRHHAHRQGLPQLSCGEREEGLWMQ